MDSVRLIRAYALVCTVVTTCGAVYAGSIATTGWEPSWGFAVQALLHAAVLVGILGLARSGAVGEARWGRLGIAGAVVGFALLALAELTYPVFPGLADPMFTIAPLLAGVGMVLAGAAVVRAGRWASWHRYMPLAAGVYVFAVLTPALVISGGPPAPLGLWAIAGWEAGWALFGLALLAEAAAGGRVRRGSALGDLSAAD